MSELDDPVMQTQVVIRRMRKSGASGTNTHGLCAKKKRRFGPPGNPERFEMVFSKKEKAAFMAAAKNQGISLVH